MDDVCQFCKSKDIHLDDYGVICCYECWENKPDLRAAMNRVVEKDPTQD